MIDHLPHFLVKTERSYFDTPKIHIVYKQHTLIKPTNNKSPLTDDNTLKLYRRVERDREKREVFDPIL
jgi:hypothetical protein